MKDIHREENMHKMLERIDQILKQDDLPDALELKAMEVFAQISLALSKFKEETFIKNAVKNQ